MSSASVNLPKIVLVGRPNVGKSVLFGKLTGRYVVVSNYPGTTVEVARGKLHLSEKVCEVVDTPGLYELSPIGDDERVTREILIQESPRLVIHVIEAANLEQSIPLTLQLLEAGFTTVVALNMMDEIEKVGLAIDQQLLEKRLGIPVVPTVSTHSVGIKELKKRIESYV
jgi:ferrous iron transport protein B